MEEMTNQYRHTPVLLAECLEHLNLKPQHTFVDSTLGGAGHSSEVAKRLGEGGLLIGIDQDEMALAADYDYFIINDDVERAAAELNDIFRVEHFKPTERIHLVKD